MMKTLINKVGDKAPKFSLPDQDGKQVDLASLKGKWVVLYSYPKDSTPGCTREAIGFTQSLKQFQDCNAVILGVSPDSGESHCKFIKKENLAISLLCDPDHKVLEEYGAWGLKMNYGKEYYGVIRSTFLIDPSGKIAHIWPKVSVDGHVEEVLTKLRVVSCK